MTWLVLLWMENKVSVCNSSSVREDQPADKSCGEASGASPSILTRYSWGQARKQRVRVWSRSVKCTARHGHDSRNKGKSLDFSAALAEADRSLLLRAFFFFSHSPFNTALIQGCTALLLKLTLSPGSQTLGCSRPWHRELWGKSRLMNILVRSLLVFLDIQIV